MIASKRCCRKPKWVVDGESPNPDVDQLDEVFYMGDSLLRALRAYVAARRVGLIVTVMRYPV